MVDGLIRMTSVSLQCLDLLSSFRVRLILINTMGKLFPFSCFYVWYVIWLCNWITWNQNFFTLQYRWNTSKYSRKWIPLSWNEIQNIIYPFLPLSCLILELHHLVCHLHLSHIVLTRTTSSDRMTGRSNVAMKKHLEWLTWRTRLHTENQCNCSCRQTSASISCLWGQWYYSGDSNDTTEESRVVG